MHHTIDHNLQGPSWGWEFSRLIILGDFSVYADAAASSKAVDVVSSMVALGLFQIVSDPMYQAGQTLDLIFVAGLTVHLDIIEPLAWSDHFVLKARLGSPPPSCLGGEQIHALPQTVMGLIGFRQLCRLPVSLVVCWVNCGGLEFLYLRSH